MPLVRIDSPSHDLPRLEAVGDAVHAALIAALAIPPDDLFQVVRSGPPGQVRYDPNFLGGHRDDGVVFVHITLRRGRTDAQKAAFYADLARRAANTGVEPRNLLIVLTENDLADWSFSDGIPAPQAMRSDHPTTSGERSASGLRQQRAPRDASASARVVSGGTRQGG